MKTAFLIVVFISSALTMSRDHIASFENKFISVNDSDNFKFWEYEVEKPPECLNRDEVYGMIVYPDSAKKYGYEGRVTIKILVGEDGDAFKLGSLTGPEIFYDEVKRVSTYLKFTPGLQNGKPVKVWVTMPFIFKLDK